MGLSDPLVLLLFLSDFNLCILSFYCCLLLTAMILMFLSFCESTLYYLISLIYRALIINTVIIPITMV